MTKDQYLFLLRAELNEKIPAGELEDILLYYSEYFADAGPEREREVMEELGSPQRLAGKILGRPAEGTVPAVEEYERPPYDPTGQAAARFGSSKRPGIPQGLFIALVVIIGAITFPVWGGLVLGLGIGGAVCILVGLGLTVGGFAFGGLASTLLLSGGGLLTVAVGAFMVLGAVALVWACVKLLRFLWNRFGEGGSDHEAF